MGVNVHALQPDSALEIILGWLNNKRRFHYISSTNINNIVMAQESDKFFRVTNFADLSLPDGIPVLWYGRLIGYSLPQRCGIEELMEATFDLSNKGYDYSHFFYGNTKEVLNALKKRLLNKYPKLNISGMYSPPFRPLTPEEDKKEVEMINKSKSDFLWVSLGCPKQETWLFDHKDQLDVVVGGGAGAVFNFMSGHTVKAPKFIQYIGLEWLLRLSLEPKRLYKRYLIQYPKLIYYLLKRNSKSGRVVNS